MQFSGTPVYMAQQLFAKKSYDQSVDIFALGTLLYEIYTKEIPYYGLDPADIKERINNDHSLPIKNDIQKQVLTLRIPFFNLVNSCRSGKTNMRPKAL